jgi:DNA modification methylase
LVGCGRLGALARLMGRHFVLIDSNPEAVAVMRKRLR